MRIALISDIHGNYTALRAALDDIDRRSVDRIICLGDVAALGPQPREVIALLRELNCVCIMGNHDEDLIETEFESHVPWIEQVTHWAIQHLTDQDRDFLRTFQDHVELEIGPTLNMLCCHGSPRSNREFIEVSTPFDKLEEMLAGHHPDVLVCGHSHDQFVRTLRTMTIVNTGSVGYPIEMPWAAGQDPRLHSRVEFAIVDGNDGSLGIELYQIPIDLNEVRRIARDSGMPGYEYWSSLWLD